MKRGYGGRGRQGCLSTLHRAQRTSNAAARVATTVTPAYVAGADRGRAGAVGGRTRLSCKQTLPKYPPTHVHL
eukprot:scaffold189979_cov28-Tisochrysis_lutea.AAC.2